MYSKNICLKYLCWGTEQKMFSFTQPLFLCSILSAIWIFHQSRRRGWKIRFCCFGFTTKAHLFVSCAYDKSKVLNLKHLLWFRCSRVFLLMFALPFISVQTVVWGFYSACRKALLSYAAQSVHCRLLYWCTPKDKPATAVIRQPWVLKNSNGVPFLTVPSLTILLCEVHVCRINADCFSLRGYFLKFLQLTSNINTKMVSLLNLGVPNRSALTDRFSFGHLQWSSSTCGWENGIRDDRIQGAGCVCGFLTYITCWGS